jgi:triphosphoribosyl-dephospho-CoA synthase
VVSADWHPLEADGFPRSPPAVADAAWQACVLEASAAKPGNVTPVAAFEDMSYGDFVRTAEVARPEFAAAGTRSVGATVLAVVEARRRVVAANTNLGIALLFAPVARAALDDALAEGALRTRVAEVLSGLDEADARDAYEAIRLASAGGLGERAEHDVRSAPAVGLREAMAQAAGYDSVASEYVTGFAIVFEAGVPALERALRDGLGVLDAIVELHVRLLAEHPDTLIARRCGPDRARAVAEDAAAVLAAGGVRSDAGREALERFDASLRGQRNRLNPGTTADLVAATLFVALLEGGAREP